jgi:hypothetical protein
VIAKNIRMMDKVQIIDRSWTVAAKRADSGNISNSKDTVQSKSEIPNIWSKQNQMRGSRRVIRRTLYSINAERYIKVSV